MVGSLQILKDFMDGKTSFSCSVTDHLISIFKELSGTNHHEDLEELLNAAIESTWKARSQLSLFTLLTTCELLVNILKSRSADKFMRIQCTVCNALMQLIKDEDGEVRAKYGKWWYSISNHLTSANVDIFQAMEDALMIQTSDSDTYNLRLSNWLEMIVVVIQHSPLHMDIFDKRVGIDGLGRYVKAKPGLNVDVANALLKLLTVVSHGFGASRSVITYGHLLPLIIHSLCDFDLKAQVKLCRKLEALFDSLYENRIIAVEHGAMQSILALMAFSLVKLDPSALGILLKIIGMIGSLSVSPTDFKFIIALFKQAESQAQLGSKLVQALVEMTQQQLEKQPRYFLSMYNPTAPSYVQCCTVSRNLLSGKGLAVFAWLRLDFQLPSRREVQSSKCRHVLYSFLTGKGVGFEAFFTESGFLVVGARLKNEVVSSTVTSITFGDGLWHSLCISLEHHRVTNSKVVVFVDGREVHSDILIFPRLDEDLRHCHVGGSPDMSFGNTHVFEKWGLLDNLKGQISSLIVFSENLSPDLVRELDKQGMNSWHFYCQREVVDESRSGAHAFPKVAVHLDAKACVGKALLDIDSRTQDMAECHNVKICRSWSIQETIHSLGGLSVLFPMLEPDAQISLVEESGPCPSVSDAEPYLESGERSTSQREPLSRGVSDQEWDVLNWDDAAPVRSSSHRLSDNIREKICRQNRISHVLSLIQHIICAETGSEKFLQQDSLLMIGLLLGGCSRHLLNHAFVESLREFQQVISESSLETKADMVSIIHKNIIFNFSIWIRLDVEVQKTLVAVVASLVNQNPAFFKGLFGVRFFFVVIELFYIDGEARPGLSLTNRRLHAASSDVKSVRVAILTIATYLIRHCSEAADIQAVCEYMADCDLYDNRELLLDEVLDVLLSVGNSQQLLVLNAIAEHCVPILYRWLVRDIPNHCRLKIIRLLQLISRAEIVPAEIKALISLKPNLLLAVGHLLSAQNVSRDVVMNLLKLGISRAWAEEFKSDVYRDYVLVLAVLKMAQVMPRPVKMEVAIKICDSLKRSTPSAEKCAAEPGWFWPVWELILKKNCHPHVVNDVMESQLVQVVMEIVHLVMWKGISGSDPQAWLNRSLPITALHEMASEHEFLVHVLVIERQLYEICIEACCEQLSSSGPLYTTALQNSVMLLRLVEDFLVSSGNAFCREQEWGYKVSNQLVELILKLAKDMNAYEDSTETGSEWSDVLEIVQNIFFTLCCNADNEAKLKEYHSKLASLLNRRANVGFTEMCFQVVQLHSICERSLGKGFDVGALSMLLVKQVERLKAQGAKSLPHDSQAIVGLPLNVLELREDFQAYQRKEEYVSFIRETLIFSKDFEARRLARMAGDGKLMSTESFWLNSLNKVTEMKQRCEDALGKAHSKFNKLVEMAFGGAQDSAARAKQDFVNNHRQKVAVLKKCWEQQRRFLTGESGVWSTGVERSRIWKMSNSENSSRMRMKIVEAVDSTARHSPCTAKAGTCSLLPSPARTYPIQIPARMNPSADDGAAAGDEDEERDIGRTGSVTDHLYQLDVQTEVVGVPTFSCPCHLVTLMNVVKGRIDIAPKFLCFYSSQEEHQGAVCDFSIAIEDLRTIYFRRFNLRRTALEVFLVDRSSFFFNFDTNEGKEEFYEKVVSLHPRNLHYYSGVRNPARLLQRSGLTEKWVNRQISNFDYLMKLNALSGRTYNDLAQYPVFPWILADYTSKTLDLNDPSVYRDLSKPIGALNPQKAKDLQTRYEGFSDPGGMFQPSHYSTHYSNPAGVLFYMVRIEPFTSLHIQLHNGHLDAADRQFFSIPLLWNSLVNGGGDVKELIPEFFFFPEFLINMNGIDFGRLQLSNESIGDVLLPPWAEDPFDFIRKHQLALESEYVSENLHHWIDLIFGYKQQGSQAVQALNVFIHFAYEGLVDWENVPDAVAAEGIINNFGQVPSQLLRKPHPQRKSLVSLPLDFHDQYVANHLDRLMFSLIEFQHLNSPVVFIATNERRAPLILDNAMPDSLVTVHQSGVFGIHGWRQNRGQRSGSFTFNVDGMITSQNSQGRRHIPGLLSSKVPISSQLFALTSDASLLICCGFWDNSIRLLDASRGKGNLVACVAYHNDVVTCIDLDDVGGCLVAGSADQTCTLWAVKKLGEEIASKPLHTLYGHTSPVTAVSVSTDLDLVVSGSQDGVCLLHTVIKGSIVHLVRPRHPQAPDELCRIQNIKISKLGRIAVLAASVLGGMSSQFLSVIGVNGRVLSVMPVSSPLSDMIVIHDKLITGSSNGTLQVLNLYRLSEILVSKNVNASISSLGTTTNGSHIFIGRSDGAVVVVYC